jgi:hypothetical protein
MTKETPNRLNETAAPASPAQTAPSCPALAPLLPVRDQCSGNAANAQEGFITQREVARRFNKSIRTIQNWMRLGMIPYIKCGRSALFQWRDIQHHLQANYRVCHDQQQPVRVPVVEAISAPEPKEDP